MCLNWLTEQWCMMTRVKPQYISALGTKRNSIGSPQKAEVKDNSKCAKSLNCVICASVVCCSVALGVTLVLLQSEATVTATTMLLSLVLAALTSILSGLCLAEYITAQCTPSVYSCCYQSTGEYLAFFFGWTSLASQTATVAAICKILASCLERLTGNCVQKLLEGALFSYAADVPAVLFVSGFTLIILTGVNETYVWFAMFMSIVLFLLCAVGYMLCVGYGQFWAANEILQWNQIQTIDTVLSTSAVCLLFFGGPQSTLRIPQSQVRSKAAAILGPLNIISFLVATVFLLVTAQSTKIFDLTTTGHPDVISIYLLITVSLCLLGIESCYPLHSVAGDMASDGLLFRSLAKHWKPFCLPVAAPFVHILTVVAVGFVSIFAPPAKILKMIVLCPVLMNSIVPSIVLWQRYRDNNSWQYEPMFQTATQTVPHHRSRSKSQEFQYVKNPGFDLGESHANEGADDHSEESSDTDVDGVVEQYKEQTRVANLVSLEGPDGQESQEPTPSSSVQAKFCIVGLLAISVAFSVALNVANFNENIAAMATVALCLMLMIVLEVILMFLPQNSDTGKTGKLRKVAKTPLIPGLASLASFSLFVPTLIQVWQEFVCWTALGLILYFVYGIRSSTAATSFHHLRTTQVSLQPLPNHRSNCVPQIIASQRRLSKTKSPTLLKIRHR